VNRAPTLNDDDAERALLGSIFLSPAIVDDVSEVLSPDDFGREAFELIFRACLTLAGRRDVVNYLTVGTALRETGDYERVGASTLVALDTEVPASGNWRSYASTIRDLSLRRKLTAAAFEIIEHARDTTRRVVDVVGTAETTIHSVSDRGNTAKAKRFREALNDEWVELQALADRPEGITGAASGLTELDHLTAGFQRSHLVVVAGRPGMGKSALAMGAAVSAAMEVKDDSEAVGIFSMEMSASENIRRILSSESRVDGTRFRDGRFTGADWPKMANASQRLVNMPLYLDDREGLSVPEVRASLRRIRSRHKRIRMVVIDYLQLMRTVDAGQNREQQVAEFSRGAKGIAKEFDCPVLALSQLNRGLESRADKRPQMSDLRESGAIEQDADLILFVYRDEVYNKDTEDKGVAELIIGKHRGGPKGTARVAFDGAFTTFRDLPKPNGF